MSFEPLQKKMIGHGVLILLVAMMAGFGLTYNLLGGIETVPGTIIPLNVPSNPAAWSRAHVGCLINALLVLAMAWAIFGMGFSEKATRRLAQVFIWTGWCNAVFYWAALFAPNRALSFGANKFGEPNLATVIALVPAFFIAFATIIGSVAIVRKAFAKA